MLLSKSYLDTQKHTANVQVWRHVKFKDVTTYKFYIEECTSHDTR